MNICIVNIILLQITNWFEETTRNGFEETTRKGQKTTSEPQPVTTTGVTNERTKESHESKPTTNATPQLRTATTKPTSCCEVISYVGLAASDPFFFLFFLLPKFLTMLIMLFSMR